MAEITKITYREDINGRVNVSIEGTQFISDAGCMEMGVIKNEETGLIDPSWPSLGENVKVYNLENGASTADHTDVGYLKGLLLSRGNKEANYTDIPKKEDYATDAEYQEAVDKYNKSIDLSSIMSAQAQFDQLIHGVVTRINDILCPNITVTDDAGETYVILDPDAPVGMDSAHEAGTELFSRQGMPRYTKTTITIGGVATEVYQYNEEDPANISSLYTISQLRINPDVLENVSKIPLSNKDNPEEVTLDVAAELIASWQKPFSTFSPNNLTTYDINEYYINFTGEIANRGNQYKTLMESQETAVQSIDTERQAVVGVSSDEELTNIIRFQHAYNASARYITVVNEMLDSLLQNL